MVHEQVREAQFVGAILGLAVGDALGYPCEFRGIETIRRVFGPAGVSEMVTIKDPRWPTPPYIVGGNHPLGTYTDDTQMSIALARGLIESLEGAEAGNGDLLDQSMRAIAGHFVTWSNSDDNDRSPGSTCMTGCANLRRGMAWRDAGVAESKGCGSAMRVAPIGLVFWRDEERLLAYSRASSLLTHGHPAALEGAGAAALLVARALAGDTPEQMYTRVKAVCGGRSSDFDACWEVLPSALALEPDTALAEGCLGESWVAEEAVASALYCYWRSPHDFRKVVLTAANTDGDSDSIACIAGGIAGAALGESAIPEEWLAVLENVDMLRELGRRLYRLGLALGSDA